MEISIVIVCVFVCLKTSLYIKYVCFLKITGSIGPREHGNTETKYFKLPLF